MAGVESANEFGPRFSEKCGSFPGIFVHALNPKGKKTPCVVRFGGFDTQKEMQYVRGTPDLVRRGISYLLVDGPGQGEMIRYRNMYLRPDFEIAGSAAYDYLAKRPDVDANRIGVVAMSLGGYYAPRIAAMDPRFAACIAWGAIWDYHATWVKRLERIKPARRAAPRRGASGWCHRRPADGRRDRSRLPRTPS